MKRKYLHGLIGMLLLVVLGVCSFETGSNVAMAAESSIDLTADVYQDENGKYVSKEISTSETPELVTSGNEDWLFAGWYKAEECTKANAYRTKPTKATAWAKFVPAEVLSVKVQVTKDADAKKDASEKVDMRMVSSVDDLNYKNIGFEVSFNGGKFIDCSGSKEVYQRISSSSEANVEYNFSPKVVDTKSEYFITHTLTGIGPNSQNGTFLIRPYWVTLDGTTVYGINRTVKVSDSYSDVVSLSVKANNNTANNFTATVGNVECTISETRYTSGEKFADLIVSTDKDALESATKYEISDGTTIIHRNHYTTYKGPGTEDVSWYEVNKDAEEFVIATDADLYGLSQISANKTFAGKSVYVISDIAANSDNWSDMKSKIEDTDTSNDPYVWTPIGNIASGNQSMFQGVFDGQGHTISGMYAKGTSCVGFFGIVGENGIVKKLKIASSYIINEENSSSSWGLTGSVVGQLQGELYDIYVDSTVTVTSKSQYTAGVAGMLRGNTIINNCWSAANVKGAASTGGIVGSAYGGVHIIEHCLNSGTIDYEANIGGLCGIVQESADVTIRDSLNVGQVGANKGNTTKYGLGSIIGRVSGKKVSIENVYATKESCNNSIQYPGTFVSGEIGTLNQSSLLGYGSYDLTELDFDKYWTVRANDTPVLKKLTDEKVCDIDTSWYDENKTVLEIKNEKELIGLSYLSQTNNFAEKTIKLVADIELNTNAPSTQTGWNSYVQKNQVNEWIPIGTETVPFAGTFEGQEHSISGLYVKTFSASDVGMFGCLDESATVQKVRVLNSYFENTGDQEGANTGAIAGTSKGASLKNVYSDAIITTTSITNSTTSKGGYAGGLIGINSGAEITIKNSWYAGTMTGAYRAAGGILGGGADTSGAKLENVLFDGKLECTAKNDGTVGGFVGLANGVVTIKTSLSAGENNSDGICGSIVGNSAWGTRNSVTAPETYATYECHANTINTSRPLDGAVQVNKVDLLGELAINGAPQLDYAIFWKTIEGHTPILRFLTETVNPDQSTTWYDANKTEFVITTAKQLRELSTLAKTEDLTGKTFKLGNDIDLNPQWVAGATAPKVLWEPIGSITNQFAGNFDGQMYTIRGLYTKVTSSAAIGLFGGVAKNVTIENVKVTNSFFENVGNTWGANTGAIVGFAQGTTLMNVYSDAIITTTEISSTNTGNGSYMGGLVGMNRNAAITIQNGWFGGTISGSNQYAGGILGGGYDSTSGGLIENCLFDGILTGTVTGGAGGLIGIGQKDTTMSYCLSAGTNECSGVCGSVAGTSAWAYRTTVTAPNTYATYECHSALITSSRTVTGAVQVNKANILGELAKTGAPNLDYTDTWKFMENSTPVLKSFYAMSPDTAWYDNSKDATEYTISTANELYGLAKLSVTESFAGKTIYLAKDITLNENNSKKYEWVTPIGTDNNPFAGTFDGNRNTIRGIYINSVSGKQGLFGNLTGTIQNVRLEDGSITTKGTQSGTIAGTVTATGNILNVYSNVDLVAKSASGYDHIGGFVGLATASADATLKIQNCWFDGSVTAAGRGVGGFVGTASGAKITLDIAHCLNTGDVSSSYGSSRTGGICGQVLNSTVVITDTLNAGHLSFSTNEYQVGSVVGVVDQGVTNGTGNVTLSSVFTTRESYVKPTSQSMEGESYKGISGVFYQVTENDRFVGYFSDYNDFVGNGNYVTDRKLDFANYWALSKTGTPILQTFAATSDVYDIETVDTELLLTTWNNPEVTVTNAKDFGNGVYQITVSDETGYTDYIAALKDAEFTCIENTMDGMYSATCSKGEWIVTVIHAAGTVNKTYISFSTGQSLSMNLSASAADTSVKADGAKNKLHMLQQEVDGNSMVIELKNGHFVVYDGGMAGELEKLMSYMKNLAGTTDGKQNPVIIEAWVISHFHADHCGALGYVRNYPTNESVRGWLTDVKVEAVYVNEPNDLVKDYEVLNQTIKTVTDLYNGIRFLQDTEGNIPTVYRMQAGQRYYFGDVTVDVVLSQELATSIEMYTEDFGDVQSVDFNDTSTWIMFNVEGEKILLAADGNKVNMDYIMDVYSQEYLTIDVFQAPHHAANTYETFTNYCTVNDYVLFDGIYNPTSYTNWTGTANTEGANYYLMEVINENRKLVGIDSIITNSTTLVLQGGNKKLYTYDTTPTIPYFYMNGKHTILTFTGTGITGTQVDIQ